MTERVTTTNRATSGDSSADASTNDDRYAGLPQYSIGQVAGFWIAVTLPMALLSWVAAPQLSDHLGGSEPLAEALFLCFTGGLLWMLGVVLVLLHRELGTLQWRGIWHALWLDAPRDPKTGRVGGKVWWWTVPFVALSVGLEALPIDPTGPMPRDFPKFLETHRAEQFFAGNWTWFAIAGLVAFLAPVVEEVVFRCFLLPRTRTVFGRRDWLANGVLFTAYHLHQPWSMPATLLDSTFAQAYPTVRFRSSWIAIVGHTLPSVVMTGVLLTLVLKQVTP